MNLGTPVPKVGTSVSGSDVPLVPPGPKVGRMMVKAVGRVTNVRVTDSVVSVSTAVVSGKRSGGPGVVTAVAVAMKSVCRLPRAASVVTAG